MPAQHQQKRVTSVQTPTLTKRCINLTVSRILISFAASLAIGCQAGSFVVINSAAKAVEAAPVTYSITDTASTKSVKLSQNSRNRYRSNSLGFSFEYPNSYMLDNSQENLKTSSEKTLRGRLELWQAADYRAIRSGKFQGGTEYPENLSISVYRNPKRLSLREWVKSSHDFVATRDFKVVSIAGQQALSFHSSGLYDSNNIVLTNTNSTEIISIRAELDSNGANKRAFQHIVSTLRFTTQ